MAEKADKNGEGDGGDKVGGDKISVTGGIKKSGPAIGSQVNIGDFYQGSVTVGGDVVYGDKISSREVFIDGVTAGKEVKGGLRPGFHSGNLPLLPERHLGMEGLRKGLSDLVNSLVGQRPFKIAVKGPAGSGKTAVIGDLLLKMRDWEVDGLGMLWAALSPLHNRKVILRRWLLDIDPSHSPGGNLALPLLHAQLQEKIGDRPLVIFLDNAQSPADVQELQFMPDQAITIMTTRDAELASAWADIVFETAPLAVDEGLRLVQDQFSLDDDIHDDPEEMKAVVERTDGRPLTLRVIGRFLAGQTARTNPQGINVFSAQTGMDELITLDSVVSTIIANSTEFGSSLLAMGAFAADPDYFKLDALDKVCDISGRRLLRREFFGLAHFKDYQVIIEKAVADILRRQMQETIPEAQRRHALYYLNEVSNTLPFIPDFENLYSQAHWAWQKTDDLDLLNDLLNACIKGQRELGLQDDTIRWLERLVQLAREKEDHKYVVSGLIVLGDTYVEGMAFEEAISHYKEILDDFTDEVVEGQRAEILYEIGDAYRRLDRLDQALTYFTNALALLQETGANPALEAATSNDVGLIYDQFGQTDQSLIHYRSALALLQEMGDEKGQATTLHNIAAALENQGRSGEALKYYQQALTLRRKLNDLPGIANTLNNIGVLYRGRGEYDLAIRNYAEALSIQESIGDSGSTAVLLHNMGLVYQESGAFERALSQFEQAERLMRAVGDRAGLAGTLDNKGRTFTQLGNYDQARKAFEEALAIKEELSDQVGRATTNRYLGDALVELSYLDEAQVHYQEAIDLSSAVGAQKLLGRAYEQMGKLYDLQGRHDDATLMLEEALAAMRQADYLEGQTHLNIVLGERFAGQKEFDKAQSSFKEAQRIASSIENWPTVIEILESSASTYLAAGDVDRTLATLNKTIKLVSSKKLERLKCAEIYLTMGTIAKEHERFAEALSYWQQSRDLYQELNNPAAKSVESLLNELQAAHGDLFDFPALVKSFFEAAGFDIEEGEDWSVLKPTHRSWRRFNLEQRIPCWLALGEALKADRVNHIYETSTEAEPECKQIFVVIDKTPTDAGWLAIATLRAQGIWVMPITHTVIYEGQADRRQRLELREQIDQMLGHRNLYEVRTPISDPLRFFGREGFANHLVEQLDEGSPVVLFGLRKMGKSSLLYYLRDNLPFPTAYVDAQASTDAFSLFDRALDKWQESLRVKAPNTDWDRPDLDKNNLAASFTDAVQDLLGNLEEQGAQDRLCLMIDELELIHPANRQSDLQNYLAVARTLRGLVQEQGQRVCLIGAAVDPFFNRSSRTGGLQNPFFKFFQEEYLQPIDQADCVQMIRSIGRQMGIEYEPGAAELIAEVSGGHPLIARQLAGLIHEQNVDGEQISIQMAMDGTELFLRDMTRADLVGENGLWAEVSDPVVWTEEQARLNIAMLSSLAEVQPLPYDQLRGQSSVQTTDYSLYELSQRAVLHKEAQKEYAIRLLLFRKWIRRYILELQD